MNAEKNAEKLRKKHIREQQKRIQPGECQKYIRMVLDIELQHTAVGRELLLLLDSSMDVKFAVRQLPEKFCVIWERLAGQQTLVFAKPTADDNDANMPSGLSSKWQIENQLIRIFSMEELQQSIRNNKLNAIIERLKQSYATMRLTLIVPSLPTKTSNNVLIERETILTELQVMHECSVLQIKSRAKELLEVLKRFTKAVAETPYKKQKSASQMGFKKYLINDNKQCVRVEGLNGLSRLWQQHLNRLPQITLEVAEALRTHYPCPNKMIADIQRDPAAASATIANLQIDRGGGVLSTSRRIGNALSTKLIKLYQSTNPLELI